MAMAGKIRKMEGNSKNGGFNRESPLEMEVLRGKIVELNGDFHVPCLISGG